MSRLARLNPDVLLFAAGLVLFAAGLSWAWLPLGPIGAGLVLMAMALYEPKANL